MKKFFEIGWEIEPIQPMCADVRSGFTGDCAKTEIRQAALELSDVVSYHNYSSCEYSIDQIERIKLLDRPAPNTEWLHRIYEKHRLRGVPALLS